MFTWIRNRIACDIVNCLYFKLPLKDFFLPDEERLRAYITGVLTNKCKPRIFIYWDEHEGIFEPGINKKTTREALG